MVLPLSSRSEYSWYMEGLEILSQPYEGYSPNEAARIVGMWDKYSDKIHELFHSVMREASTCPNKELSDYGKRFYELSIAIYTRALDKHYARRGRKDPYRINLPPRRLTSLELYQLLPKIYEKIVCHFHALLNETNYMYSAVMSWNAMYFILDVIFGRREILRRLGIDYDYYL
jgi:hypothetical protein